MKSIVATLSLFFLCHQAVAQPSAYPFQWHQGIELLLFGSGDLAATNDYLRPLGLEAIPDHGASTVAISPGEYKDSNFGQFSMSFAAVMARPIGSAAAESWYFFGLTSSKPGLNQAFSQIWNMESAGAETQVTIGWSVPWNEAETFANGKMILKVFMGDRDLPAAESSAYHFDVFSSTTSSGLVRYHHDCTGLAQNKNFAAEKGDTWWADPTTQIGTGLHTVKFVPTQWSLYRTDFGGFTSPLMP